jgi:hypothetical protein
VRIKSKYGIYGLIRSSGEAAVEIHAQVLVEDDGEVAGAGLHFLRCPSRDPGNLGSAELLKLGYRTIVEGDFLEPGAALFQFGRQLVAQVH